MTTKARKTHDRPADPAPADVEAEDAEQTSAEEAVAPDAAPDQDVAPEESPAPAPTAAAICAECGSSDVVVATGQGAAERSYCAKDAPVNARR